MAAKCPTKRPDSQALNARTHPPDLMRCITSPPGGKSKSAQFRPVRRASKDRISHEHGFQNASNRQDRYDPSSNSVDPTARMAQFLAAFRLKDKFSRDMTCRRDVVGLRS